MPNIVPPNNVVLDQALVTKQLKGIGTLSEKDKIAEYSVYLPNIWFLSEYLVTPNSWKLLTNNRPSIQPKKVSGTLHVV